MKVLIIGSGTSAHSCAEKIMDNRDIEIKMFTKENNIEYSPCVLPDYIAGEISKDALFLREESFYDRYPNIIFKKDTEIKSINFTEKYVTTNKQNKYNYDKLVIASGAEAMMPDIEGVNLEGNYKIKNLNDARKIKEINNQKIFVIGSGPIGVEISQALHQNNEVTLVEKEKQILPKLFDKDISDFANNILENMGINIILNSSVNKISGKNKVEEVRCEDNSYNCDKIIWCIGMCPSTSYIDNKHMDLDKRGFIKTNEYMKTNINDVYACGDCTKTYDVFKKKYKNVMLWHIAKRGGKIVGENILGFDSSMPFLENLYTIKIGSHYFGALGENSSNNESLEIFSFNIRNKYFKFKFRGDKLVNCQTIDGPQILSSFKTKLNKKIPRLKQDFKDKNFIKILRKNRGGWMYSDK